MAYSALIPAKVVTPAPSDPFFKTIEGSVDSSKGILTFPNGSEKKIVRVDYRGFGTFAPKLSDKTNKARDSFLRCIEKGSIRRSNSPLYTTLDCTPSPDLSRILQENGCDTPDSVTGIQSDDFPDRFSDYFRATIYTEPNPV